MQYLLEVFSAVSVNLGKSVVVNWAGLVATYYAWHWLGWSWLMSLNSLFAMFMVPLLHVAAVILVVGVIIKVGLWIKSFFGGEK